MKGIRSAALVSIGIAAGCLGWGLAAATGLAALLTAWPMASGLLKISGALYVIWLGARLISGSNAAWDVDFLDVCRDANFADLRRGFLTNILNPKVGLFYATFIPQFVPYQGDVGTVSLLLALVHIMVGILWSAVLISATVPMRRFLKRPRAITALNRITGFTLIVFGAKLALTEH